MGGKILFFSGMRVYLEDGKKTYIIIFFWVGVVVVVGHGGYQRLNILNSLIYQDELTDIGETISSFLF